MVTTKKPTTTKKATTPVVVAAPVFAQTRFINKNILIGPRKLRLMANQIKIVSPLEAMAKLKFTNTKSARILVKSILSAVNDAKSNHHLTESTLKFKSIRVDEGQKIKRMDKSHGSRFSRGVIIKRHSRLEIILTGQKQQ